MAHTMCHLTKFCSLWYKNQSTNKKKPKQQNNQQPKPTKYHISNSWNHKALTLPILTGRYCTTVPFCLPAASCFPFGLQHTRQKKKKIISLALRNWRVTKPHKNRTNKLKLVFFSLKKNNVSESNKASSSHRKCRTIQVKTQQVMMLICMFSWKWVKPETAQTTGGHVW